ncbi:MAG: DegT/DnrJ/EryC1/StrS family aminotransferase [Proteobacteria bacterium]|nr:DegT/DnrJ/EryC1/StrS family aminotransferase [Pseudomonadota bacterium]
MIKIPQSAVEFFKQNIDEIFFTGNLAEGKWNKELSNHVSEYCGVKHATPTSSNGSGLVALMLIYKEYFNRSEVLLQSNTMYGVKTMVYSAGCHLSGFIGCTLDTLMPSFEQVKQAVEDFVGDKKKMIILLSHIGGIINPDIERIAEFCRSENIILLEDCAHSYGATINGKHSGTFGDAGAFSFYATKSVPAGEGGIVITKHDDIGEYIKRFIIYDRFEQKMKIGNNNRPSEIQALLIYAVVKCTDEIIKNKKGIADKYIAVCNELSIPYIKQNAKTSLGNYYKFIVYNAKIPISEYLPTLKTKTSGVYDYSLGNSKSITTHHACLPIWYGQENEVTEKVISELYASRLLVDKV